MSRALKQTRGMVRVVCGRSWCFSGSRVRLGSVRSGDDLVVIRSRSSFLLMITRLQGYV